MSRKNKGVEQRKLETQEIARNLVEDLHFFKRSLKAKHPQEQCCGCYQRHLDVFFYNNPS